MEWKRPSANDHFRLGEEAVALLAAARAGRAWRQVACRGEGGPGLANFTVEPASRVDQPDLRIARFDLGTVIGADRLGSQHVDGSHEGIPPCAAVANNRCIAAGSSTSMVCPGRPSFVDTLLRLLRGNPE